MERTMSGLTVFEAFTVVDTNLAALQERVDQKICPAGDLMTDKDVAVIVGVSDATIRSWAARGRITRHTQPDGSVRFDARQVWDHARRASDEQPAAG